LESFFASLRLLGTITPKILLNNPWPRTGERQDPLKLSGIGP
jgi:hypothetical protein